MTSLLTSLYLLSFKQTETVHGIDLDCVKISNKSLCMQGLYPDAKSEFFRSRCSDNKQHWGLKKNLKSVEKLFKSYKCIFLSWEKNQPLLMLFSNGSVACIEFNEENNSLKNIEIDNSLCGKFIPSRVVDAIICQNYIFITYSEPKLTIIHINKETTSFSSKILGKKKGKLIGSESKITHIDLIGPSSKNLERKLSLNSYKDHLLIWWRFTGTDVWPWTPVSYAADRINMLIYALNDCIEILCSVKVHGELINAKYSAYNSNQILTLVEVKSEKGISINISVYEIIRDQCHHAFVMQLPLQGKVLSFDWSSTDKLLISDSNNLLLIYDLKKKTSIVTNLLFTPKLIVWHPQDCVALIASSTGQIQCFDAALTCIKFKLYYKTFLDCNILELNSRFAQSCSVMNLIWQKSNLNDTSLIVLDSDMSSIILLKFTLGCITRNNLSISELINQYLKSDFIDEAILLLKSLNWYFDNELHFQCLSNIANFLLRKPLNLKSQAGLELALGTFYSNMDDLPKRIIKLYQHKINHIARRFFHHLLRYHQFRKAFLLAVDLESQDLFLDLFHMAMQKGENALACAALHKANKLIGSQNSASNSSVASDISIETSTASDDADWDESNDAHIQLPENERFGNSSDQQYWLPVPEKTKVNNSWLNASEADSHIHQTSFEEQFLPNTQLLNPNNYKQVSSQYNFSYGAENHDSNPSFCDKMRYVPVLKPKPLPLPPFPSHSKPSELYEYVNNSPIISSSPTSIKLKYDTSSNSNEQLLTSKSEESTWHLPSTPVHKFSYNTKSRNSDLSLNDKLCYVRNPNPRPLPALPSYYQNSSETYAYDRNLVITSMRNKSRVSMQSNNEQLLVGKSMEMTKNIAPVNKTIDEENEEIEDSRIKLKHFGIV
ncbi:WD repeat-containing and planar cell polarity effector protein fritz homolog [Nephila pilipes]|uniref:WD repeat-containing and planar cell polarity effector protein fritz homolog n=1 Tax=Nephila pilipes TaxID=299642 RepID=A0A8X6PPJ6_NEPPI|nr:WD repeat-containing and planar cell polarity effector protein fritz homolog [Nephila pilipes]